MLYVTYEGVLFFYNTMIYKENFMGKLAEALNEHFVASRFETGSIYERKI